MAPVMEMIEQPETKMLELVFSEEEDSIRANDLQGFLFYYNMYYMKFVSEYNLDDVNVYDLINQREELKSRFEFSRNDYLNYSRKIYSDSNDLLIFELEKHSPLKFVFGGSIIALVAALILSGGTVEINVSNGVFKAEINQSLGKSLKDLKELSRD